MFERVKGAIRCAEARSALGIGNIPLARSKIEEAKRLLGEKLNRASVYYVNITAAEIYSRSGDSEMATAHLNTAESQIKSNKRLPSIDRDYLLDYCHIFRRDINKVNEDAKFRLDASRYASVNDRIRREFPINWR